ncbi:GNAT family N-acetyltransferase [Candidatus Nitrososphaera sp. FF02]|uniref:GNAT family N-acetyltransferase n=1 Tax=Candidatus Nitrososphaera sp. FF02 TaxID=3398226 RepID=UPI0039E8C75F
MTAPVKSASESEEARLIDVLALAFVADPAARWVWPDPHKYLVHFPHFARAFGGRAFAHGSAYYTEGYSGAALWLPPNVHPDQEALAAILQSTVREQVQKEAFAVFDQMGSYHPAEPHYYLPLLGVDPSQHGRGLGSALMQHAIGRCDRENKVAYLESSNPKNVPFYQKHGFELLGKIQAGSSPVIFPMLRKPRPAA